MKAYYAPIFIFIMLITILLLFRDNTDLSDNIAKQKERVEQFEREAVIKDNEILILNREKDSLNTLVGSLNKQISEARKEIETIRKKKNEKINVVNSYTTEQLQQFFAENYPE